MAIHGVLNQRLTARVQGVVVEDGWTHPPMAFSGNAITYLLGCDFRIVKRMDRIFLLRFCAISRSDRCQHSVASYNRHERCRLVPMEQVGSIASDRTRHNWNHEWTHWVLCIPPTIRTTHRINTHTMRSTSSKRRTLTIGNSMEPVAKETASSTATGLNGKMTHSGQHG